MADKIVFDGGSTGGFPTHPDIRRRWPRARVHIHLSRRKDGTVYRDGGNRTPILVINPGDEREIGYCIGEEILHELREIERELAPRILTSIKIHFQGATMATAGPITLTSVGQTATASVVGFDQFGQPFTGTIPTPTFTASDTTGAIATFDPSTGIVTAVANGVDNITATLTTAEGLSLTDTEAVTVAIPVVPPPTPVLTTIKVAFA